MQAFTGLHQRRDDLAAHLVAAGGAGVGGAAIPWLQGVEDEAFQSPSRSLCGTEMENLRTTKRGRSVSSPDTNYESVHDDGDDVHDMAAVAATAESDDEEDGVVAGPSKKRSARKVSDASTSTHPIQKVLKKDVLVAGKNKNNILAIQEERTDESPTATASRSSGGGGVGGVGDDDGVDTAAAAAAVAKQQLDDLVAGLDSSIDAEPTLPLPPPPPHRAAVPAPPQVTATEAAALSSLSPKGKENQQKESKKKTTQQGKKAAVVKKSSAVTTTTTTAPKTADGRQRGRKRASDGDLVNDEGGRSRRIPTRLLPWNCIVCTFENKCGDGKCQMCQTVRGAETPPPPPPVAVARVLEADGDGDEKILNIPTAIAAVLATTTTTTTTIGSSKGGEKMTTTTVSKRKKAPFSVDVGVGVGGPQQQQRKLTGGKHQQQKTKKRKENTPPPPITTTTTTTTWQTTTSSSWVLLGSGLDAAGKEQLRAVATAAGATIANTWSPRVTHVICGSTTPSSSTSSIEEKSARRTFKYLMGVLHGQWVLTQQWAAACLSSNTAVGESAFQVERDSVGSMCGAAVARAAVHVSAKEGVGAQQQKQEQSSTAAAAVLLLKGFEVQLQGDFANRGQMIELIKAAGATVVSRLPTTGAAVVSTTATPTGKGRKINNAAAAATSGGGVVIVEVPDTSAAAAAGYAAAVVNEHWFSKAVAAGVPVASHRWVTDSISTFKLCELNEFLIK